jgi:hypothetical protein
VLLIITPMLKINSMHESFRTHCKHMAILSESIICRLKRNDGNHWRGPILFVANKPLHLCAKIRDKQELHGAAAPKKPAAFLHKNF